MKLFKLSLLLLALLLPVSALAYDFEVDGIYYNIDTYNSNNVIVTYKDTNYNSYSGDIVIPNSVTYNGKTYSVASIGSSAFNRCTTLTNVDIPNSVTYIGSSAFNGCTTLTSVDIPNSVTYIGSSAFNGCTTLTNINIPNSVNTIGSNAFYNCSALTCIIIPNSVTTIGENAFYDCKSLTSIDMGNSIVSIGHQAFEGCWALKRVNITDIAAWCKISFYYYQANPLYYAQHLYLNGVEVTNITIPDSVNSIGRCAFTGYNLLTSVVIGNTVTSIGDYAFEGCRGLKSVVLGESVTDIGGYSFRNCDNLCYLTWNAIDCPMSISNNSYISFLQFGNNVEHIPAYLPLLNMAGKVLKIPNSVKTIDAGAIRGNCAGVIIGNGLENIVTGTFPSSISVAYATTAEPLPCESGAFANPKTLYVPAGSKNKYFTAPGWSEFTNIIEGEYIPATAIEVDKKQVHLYRDATMQLTATVLPDTVSATSIGWYSIDSNVAEVNSNGLVTAKAVGETDIIVWVDQVSDTCHVKVTPILVENITLSNNQLSMSLDEMHTLVANITPDNAENKTLEWEISDNEVLATQVVNNNKLNISAENEGSVTITVRATDGSGVSATCEVFVSATTPVKSLTVSPETLNLYVSYSEQLNATITPLDAYTQELRWFSSNENVATVDNNGRVTGRNVGTATITAVTTDGSNLSATCTVTVTNIPVESVTLNYSEIAMYEGNSTNLYATVLPSNAMNKTLRWESSNPRVATVSSNGRVNALEVGTTIITATSTDGTDISAACRVTVRNYTTSNCFSMPDSEVLHGESVTIPVRLTNDQDILAFQTNIYLPEGFTMVTDENDEFLITPSDRLTSDHVLMADRLGDGGVRVICYTPQEAPICGYEGDLFYITITAPEHAAHDYAINLRNSLLTNTDYQELSIPDAGAVLTVNTFMMGDVNDSHSVTVTDIVVTAQYVLGRNPSPFISEAADMNGDGNITVTDIMLIAYLINHPTMNAPKRMPHLEGGNDRMSGEDVTLMAGETRTVSIMLDNETDYTAFQLDLTLPAGLTASNFQLTDRAGSHAFDVNTLGNGKIRALCYSPAIEVIDGHEGALLTFDVAASDDIKGIITVDGIELVTVDCQTVLMNSFTIGVNSATSVNELNGAKTVARVDYFNLAGQQIDRPGSGVTLVVTTYTDGTRSTTKVIK